DSRADIERGLIHIRDEKMSFCSVGDSQRELLPGPFRIERPLVVPGTEQSEYFATETTTEQAIHLVHSPNQPGRSISQNLAAQETLEVHARTFSRVPNLLGISIEIKLFCERFRQS